jgi:ferric-dicitrate binding protein FerR (iron transport regulator)
MIMMNDPSYHPLRELSWRRKLTAAEAAELQAWLAAHPETRADWEAEAGLNEALGRLAGAPVPSNFTARVLQAVERDAAAELRRRKQSWQVWRRWRWLPKAAFAAVVLSAGLISYEQAAKAARPAEYGQSVAVVADVSSLPGPDVLKDFDAIRALKPTPSADEELLVALK